MKVNLNCRYIGDNIIYLCIIIRGDNKVSWSLAEHCPTLFSIQNADVARLEGMYPPVAVVTCNLGYQLADGSTIRSLVCEDGWSWNAHIEACHGKQSGMEPLLIDQKLQMRLADYSDWLGV